MPQKGCEGEFIHVMTFGFFSSNPPKYEAFQFRLFFCFQTCFSGNVPLSIFFFFLEMPHFQNQMVNGAFQGKARYQFENRKNRN